MSQLTPYWGASSQQLWGNHGLMVETCMGSLLRPATQPPRVSLRSDAVHSLLAGISFGISILKSLIVCSVMNSLWRLHWEANFSPKVFYHFTRQRYGFSNSVWFRSCVWFDYTLVLFFFVCPTNLSGVDILSTTWKSIPTSC